MDPLRAEQLQAATPSIQTLIIEDVRETSACLTSAGHFNHRLSHFELMTSMGQAYFLQIIPQRIQRVMDQSSSQLLQPRTTTGGIACAETLGDPLVKITTLGSNSQQVQDTCVSLWTTWGIVETV